MKNFQEKKRFRQVMQSKPVLMLLGIMILVFAYSVFGLVGRMQETIKNKEVAEEKIQELQKEKDQLTANINELKTDQGVEENIREKFGLAKDGEGMVVVTDDKNSTVTDTEDEPTSFFSKIINFFK
jgi:cell division protein FtsB